jgi:hypothetical protein
LFIQVTVPPTETVTGFGLYAVVVSVLAPETIDTLGPVVVGDGIVVVELWPHATAAIRSPARTTRRGVMFTVPFEKIDVAS